MSEQRVIPFAPAYLVDRTGVVWSTYRGRFPGSLMDVHPLAPKTNKDDYKEVTLCVDGQRSYWFVHVLVLETFVGPRPDPKAEGCHRDGDPANNQLENLYWGTHADNVADRERHGRTLRGQDASRAKLTDESVRDIKFCLSQGESASLLAGIYGVTPHHIRRIRRGDVWGHIQ